MTASKQKGTSGEREVLRRLETIYGIGVVVRTPPASRVDIIAAGLEECAIGALYTRPDHGCWLVTLSASDFEGLLEAHPLGPPHLDVEVKRHAKFAIHSIYEQKLGKP